jgi:hypothetical protein
LLLKDEKDYSSILTSLLFRPEVDLEDFLSALNGQGYVIYAGQRAMNGKIFPIAVTVDLLVQYLRGFVGGSREILFELQ